MLYVDKNNNILQEDYAMNDITKIKVDGEPESSYQLYPRNEEFAKRAGGGSGSIPKPLTYDYMPEGYPTKSVQTTTLMEEQEVAFTLLNGLYVAQLTNAFEIVEGKTYTVNWDGTEYECVSFVFNSVPMLGNLSIIGNGNDTGEPFIYSSVDGIFATLNTSASHTISVKTTEETVTPMAEEFIPVGVGGGGVQPDWNQNDSTAADYVKNRPIYEKDGLILPEQSFNFTSQGVVLAQFEDSFVESTEYKVTFDGTEYTCICANNVIGDFRFKKYPFAIGAGSGVLVGLAATASNHTLSLSGKTIHTLSERFLPHSTAKTMEITFRATEDELVAAYNHFNSGGVLYLANRLVNNIKGSLDSAGITFQTQQLNATFMRLSDGSITNKSTYALTEFPDDGVANQYFYLASSTDNSTKKFRITVDDSGALTATEVT